MKVKAAVPVLILIAVGCLLWPQLFGNSATNQNVPTGRERVVFWHFWGGQERKPVQEIVQRFNESQNQFWVEEIAIPGQNLDMKFFMAIAGGDFPDLLNQDDQIIAQWAHRDVLMPMSELTDDDQEYQQLVNWLSPAAKKIGTYQGKLYALCNALDIRTIMYRLDILTDGNTPTGIQDFDEISLRASHNENSIPYLPDDRRLWAWGVAFGGDFYDEETGTVTANHPKIVEALTWMTSYSQFHGVQKIRAFRSTNREAGAGSMLLDGRYSAMMDGQWRVSELDSAIQQAESTGNKPLQYAVAPLPHPQTGRENAGWVNGNFFIVPKGCKNPAGAWAFMKFWSGFGGHEAEAAKSAASGGWVPASKHVVEQPAFQQYLDQHPKFRLFVKLAESPNQIPTPAVPVQAFFYERVNRAAEEALTLQKSPQAALDSATADIQNRLDAIRNRSNP